MQGQIITVTKLSQQPWRTAIPGPVLSFDEMGIPTPGRSGQREATPTRHHNPDQLSLFGMGGATKREREVLGQLRATDPNQMTPLEALTLLAQLTTHLEDDE